MSDAAICSCHFQKPEFCTVHKKTISEIFEESRARFAQKEKEAEKVDDKIKDTITNVFVGALLSIGALALAFVVAMLPAWATLWSINRLGIAAIEITLGTVFATSWLMSLAGFGLWRLKGGK